MQYTEQLVQATASASTTSAVMSGGCQVQLLPGQIPPAVSEAGLLVGGLNPLVQAAALDAVLLAALRHGGS